MKMNAGTSGVFHMHGAITGKFNFLALFRGTISYVN